jgi:ribonuclease HI
MATKKDFEIFLYKNKINSKTLIDILPQLSSKTISNLYNDLEQLYKSKNTDKNTDKLCIFTDAKEANELSKELENIPNNKLYVFSDGNVKNNGKTYSKGGYSIYFGEIEPFKQFNKTMIKTNQPTNNEMELSGIKLVFKTIYKNKELFTNKEVLICSDSQYSINCIENWSSGWIKNGWVNSKKEPVKNKELIQKILEFKSKCKDISIKFKHVFGHTKEPSDKKSLEWLLWFGNNKVDDNINYFLEKTI